MFFSKEKNVKKPGFFSIKQKTVFFQQRKRMSKNPCFFSMKKRLKNPSFFSKKQKNPGFLARKGMSKKPEFFSKN